jgi:TRAP-type C4-dicarboxylate transport system permease small subunit
MMGKFDKFVNSSSKWLNVIAGFGMFYVFIVSFADIIMNKVFKDPINWAFDSIGLLAVVAIAAAIPQVQIGRGHIEIEFIEKRLGPILRKIVNLLINLLSILIWIIVAWRSFVYGQDILRSGEVSMSVGMPIFPFIWFQGLCAVFVVFVLMLQTIKISRAELQ